MSSCVLCVRRLASPARPVLSFCIEQTLSFNGFSHLLRSPRKQLKGTSLNDFRKSSSKAHEAKIKTSSARGASADPLASLPMSRPGYRRALTQRDGDGWVNCASADSVASLPMGRPGYCRAQTQRGDDGWSGGSANTSELEYDKSSGCLQYFFPVPLGCGSCFLRFQGCAFRW